MTHLNQYNVVYLEITSFISEARTLQKPLIEVPGMIMEAVHDDLLRMYPDLPKLRTVNDELLYCAEKPDGRPFVFIIDEWDAVIREAKEEEEAQQAYLSLLRGWFKSGTFTPKAVAVAYMTGILPIKKDGKQSAISDFHEFSMLYPGEFAKFTGFSETEVRRLCRKNKMDFDDMKAWYDGYELSGEHAVYNPYSVMNACREKECRSFWGKTSASEALTDYIDMNFDGLQETVASLIGGAAVAVNTSQFQNDFERFRTKDDVLTLLVHLGYLTYDSVHRTVYVPNEEVRDEFRGFLGSNQFSGHWVRLIRRSRKLLEDTVAGNCEAVASVLMEIREEQYAPQYYNDEQALRAVVKYAYFAAFGQYVKVEEMPSGKGIADVVFIPASLSRLPAMVIELKWNKTSGGAIAQIKNKRYTAVLEPFAGNILLAGINYDEKTGKHTCAIERM
ncbi:MAG: ATP-binding protein [Lachnospiraceae bacterium]